MRQDQALDAGSAPAPAAADERARALVGAHYDFIWRTFRRLGLAAADAEDATQQVFVVATRRIDTIQPGKERSFLFTTALHELSHRRRGQRRRREVTDDDRVEGARDAAAGPDELLDRHRARALLDEILAAMPEELKIVFVLFELQEIGTAEIAEMLGVPAGTVASRLRRAREAFHAHLARMQARAAFAGGIK